MAATRRFPWVLILVVLVPILAVGGWLLFLRPPGEELEVVPIATADRGPLRVTVLERTNVRYLEQLPDNVLAQLAVIDASFISLSLVLPATLRLLTDDADNVALIKPQFEAGKEQVGKGGVIRDERIHRQVIEQTWALADTLGLNVGGLCVSPLLGPAGNTEFLIWLRRGPVQSLSMDNVIQETLDEARQLRKRA